MLSLRLCSAGGGRVRGGVTTMKRVFFIGSWVGSGDSSPFVEMGRELGRAAAYAGLRIVVGSETKGTLDRAVIEGAWEAVPGVEWELFEPNDGRHRYTSYDGPRPSERVRFGRGDGRWEFPHLSAALGAHAVVALGGRANTRRALRAADARGVPVWPVPRFGGAAAKMLAALVDRASREDWRPHDATVIRELAVPAPSIGRVFREIVRSKPERRRSYFLSYAHEDCGQTDEVEMFLRREGRGVLRDETTFRPGNGLTEEARQWISAADDVLVMDSSRSALSEYVAAELAYAYELQDGGRGSEQPNATGRRVLGVLLEEEVCCPGLRGDDLHVPGQDRQRRETAVKKLVKHE
ncbi:MAG: TIR domain-containing protein [Sandaracinaceae bacterium]|nr:MAG: TIR domain-containing protein [Sandaracinaceae bacterium]